MKYLTKTLRKDLEDLTRRVIRERLGEKFRPVVNWTYSRHYMGLSECGLLHYWEPKISYSAPLFQPADPREQVETVYHEVSHLLHFYEVVQKWTANGSKGSFWPDYESDGRHGPRFRQFMAEFGYLSPTGCER